MRTIRRFPLAISAALLFVGGPALAFTLTPIATGFTAPIGIDYNASADKMLLSVNYPTGNPHNFELVAADGTHSQFSTVAGLTDEIYIGCARDTTGGFVKGSCFTGNGQPGQIVQISADGTTVQNPWVTLPGDGGLLRGGLHVDRTGVWGGDLIVTTTAGNIWRVTSAGTSTLLAHVAASAIEGPTTVPNDAVKYGPWAGKIIVGDEHTGLVYSVDTAGTVVNWSLPGASTVEGLHVIPANENFFGVDYADGKIMGAGPTEWAPYVGDILLVNESGSLYAVRWNPLTSNFDATFLASVSQWEGTAFSPAGIVNLPPTCPPVPVCTRPECANVAVCACTKFPADCAKLVCQPLPQCQNQPPVARCANRTVAADANCQGCASVDNGSSDPDGDAVTCTQTPACPYHLGANPVVLTCTDAGGLSSACTATVTVVDQTPPTIACPADEKLECVNGGAVASFAPTASDNCGPPVVACAPPSGSTFPITAPGPTCTADTCTATDLSGNTASCSFHVCVQATVAPTVTVKTDVCLPEPKQAHGGGKGNKDDKDDHQGKDGEDEGKKSDTRTVSLADCIGSITSPCFGALDPNQVGVITRVERLGVEEDDDGCRPKHIVIGGASVTLSGSDENGTYDLFFTITDPSGNQTTGSCRVKLVEDARQCRAHKHKDDDKDKDKGHKHKAHGHDDADDVLGCVCCVGTGCGACPIAHGKDKDDGGKDDHARHDRGGHGHK